MNDNYTEYRILGHTLFSPQTLNTVEDKSEVTGSIPWYYPIRGEKRNNEKEWRNPT